MVPVTFSAPALASWLLAQAGSGSSGFSGGGGGGGGGGGFSGGGSYSGGGSSGGGGLFLVLIVAVLIFVAISTLARRAAIRRREAARAARDSEVRSAAAVAAADDGAFDADAIREQAAALVLAAQAAWDARDRDRIRQLIGGDLLAEWLRRLDDFDAKRWHNRVVVTGRPEIQLISIVNRAEDAADRAVVHVRLAIESWVDTPAGKQFPTGQTTPAMTLSEYWTLAKRDGGWILVSIEQEDEGEHNLRSTLVLTPDQDPELAAAARTELAVGDAAAPAAEVASLVSTGLSDDARGAALDLSLVDDRFSPDVLTIAVDRAVAAWADAIDGADDDLRRLATADAARTLLYGDDASEATRTVVRGPRVASVTIERVSGAASDGGAPTMEVALDYRARWYREDRATAAVLAGSKDRETERRARWTFALGDDPRDPWQLIAARD